MFQWEYQEGSRWKKKGQDGGTDFWVMHFVVSMSTTLSNSLAKLFLTDLWNFVQLVTLWITCLKLLVNTLSTNVVVVEGENDEGDVLPLHTDLSNILLSNHSWWLTLWFYWLFICSVDAIQDIPWCIKSSCRSSWIWLISKYNMRRKNVDFSSSGWYYESCAVVNQCWYYIGMFIWWALHGRAYIN